MKKEIEHKVLGPFKKEKLLKFHLSMQKVGGGDHNASLQLSQCGIQQAAGLAINS